MRHRHWDDESMRFELHNEVHDAFVDRQHVAFCLPVVGLLDETSAKFGQEGGGSVKDGGW